MIKNPDDYFIKGCGRCKYFATLECKVQSWKQVLNPLREIIGKSVLTEEAKWGVPCYTFEGRNILILSAFREYCSISFFKGALLSDPHGLLIAPTKNSHYDRSLRLTSTEGIEDLEPIILEYIDEAVEIETSGKTLPPKPVEDFEIAVEFQAMLDADPALQSAFDALTPGRQKGYLLHFSGAKQSKTRISRIEKCLPRIFDGIGLQDRYD
jgi:uncharacterized protein YdeI (YjbR/CyaY-like superfamily)